MWTGKNIVVVGGGSVGCEVADFVAPLVNDRHPNNKKVTVIEMKSNIIMDDTSPSRSILVQRMADKGVNIITDSRVVKVTPTTLEYQKDGNTITIENVDTVIEATGYYADHELKKTLDQMQLSYNVLGDAATPGKIKNAISDAYHLCKNI